ncbi:MAG: hypothetical protein FWG11_05505 [Promicromonosporaceae bacterium]|nr:hypothetical protein [Promicromonosporaceae bacterium]
MKRKTAAIYLGADAALIVTLAAVGGPSWTIWAMGLLALPALLVTVLPGRERRRDA